MKCNLPKEEKVKVNGSVDMSLYDMNKQIIGQLPPMSQNIESQTEHLTKFIEFLQTTRNKYYMLLCKEISYFTLFHRSGDVEDESFEDVLEEILTDFGTWVTWSPTEDGGGIEYWVKRKEPKEEDEAHEEVYCFILFPYDAGLVEVY